MLQRIAQIDFNRSDTHAQLRGDFVVRLLLHNCSHEHLARTRRQFRQRTIEGFDILTPLHDCGSVRRIIRNVEQRVDSIEAKMTLFDSATVGGNIERDAKQIIFRALDRRSIRHPFDAQKSFLQGIAR